MMGSAWIFQLNAQVDACSEGGAGSRTGRSACTAPRGLPGADVSWMGLGTRGIA